MPPLSAKDELTFAERRVEDWRRGGGELQREGGTHTHINTHTDNRHTSSSEAR